jgi:AraC-like DNA-binding protein
VQRNLLLAPTTLHANLSRMHSRSSDEERPSWGAASDPLSSVLLDLRLSGTFFCNSEFARPWALEIPERDFASFHFVATGDCWLQPVRNGRRAQAVDLHPGDLVVLPRSPRQVFSSDKQRVGTPLDDLPMWRLGDSASALRMGSAEPRWLVVCGGVRFDGFAAITLVNLLPEVVLLRGHGASPIVAGALAAMRQESLAARPGGATLMTRLADVVVIHAIRAWIEAAEPSSGWLAALRDPQIGRVIAEVHQRPEDAWSVEIMAGIAHLSRSRFSQRFSQLLGEAPMQYVTKVRMQRAREQLRSERVNVAELAERFGYESEPAFARAFKRHTGISPGAARYAEGQKGGSSKALLRSRSRHGEL